MSVRLRHDDLGPPGGGAGPPLLLIHGAVQTRAVWAAQAAALAPLRRIIVPDLRGHGETPLGDEPLSIALMAEDCLVLLRDLGIGRAVVCGVSLGDMVAIEMAARAPEAVAALVLANTPRSLTGVAWLRRLLGALDPQRLLFPVFGLLGRERAARIGLGLARLAVGPQWVGRTARRHFVLGFTNMSDEAIVSTYGAIVDSRPVDLGRIGCPCLVVDGVHDAPSIREQAGEIDAEVETSRRVVLKAGHVANLDDPAAFNRVLLDFLAEIDGPAARAR